MDAPAAGLRGGRGALLELRESLQDQLAHVALCRHVDDRAQQGEAATLTIDGVGTGGESDVATVGTSAFPDAEANQLETRKRSVVEVQLRAANRQFGSNWRMLGSVVLAQMEPLVPPYRGRCPNRRMR
jgi:hypothetical protein